MRRAWMVVGLCLGLLGNVAAQRTWVVDADARPGFDFLDLATALAAVRAGDTLRVRGGNLRPVPLVAFTKGVQVLAEDDVLFTGNVLATGIPAGETLTLQGRFFDRLSTIPGYGGSQVSISDCAGKVILDGILFPTTSSPSMEYAHMLSIENCAWVFAKGATGGGNSTRLATIVNSSRVVLEDCTLWNSNPSRLTGGVGLVVTQSDVTLLRTFVVGLSVPFGDFRWCQSASPCQPGASLRSSVLRLLDHADVWGGVCRFCPFAQWATSIVGDRASRLVRDPTIIVRDSTGVFFESTPGPALSAVQVWNSNSVDVRVEARPGTIYGIFASLPGTPLVLEPVPVLLDPSTIVHIAGGTLGTTGIASHPVFLGPTYPRGLPVMFQGVGVNSSVVAFSNPTLAVVR